MNLEQPQGFQQLRNERSIPTITLENDKQAESRNIPVQLGSSVPNGALPFNEVIRTELGVTGKGIPFTRESTRKPGEGKPLSKVVEKLSLIAVNQGNLDKIAKAIEEAQIVNRSYLQNFGNIVSQFAGSIPIHYYSLKNHQFYTFTVDSKTGVTSLSRISKRFIKRVKAMASWSTRFLGKARGEAGFYLNYITAWNHLMGLKNIDQKLAAGTFQKVKTYSLKEGKALYAKYLWKKAIAAFAAANRSNRLSQVDANDVHNIILVAYHTIRNGLIDKLMKTVPGSSSYLSLRRLLVKMPPISRVAEISMRKQALTGQDILDMDSVFTVSATSLKEKSLYYGNDQRNYMQNLSRIYPDETRNSELDSQSIFRTKVQSKQAMKSIVLNEQQKQIKQEAFAQAIAIPPVKLGLISLDDLARANQFPWAKGQSIMIGQNTIQAEALAVAKFQPIEEDDISDVSTASATSFTQNEYNQLSADQKAFYDFQRLRSQKPSFQPSASGDQLKADAATLENYVNLLLAAIAKAEVNPESLKHFQWLQFNKMFATKVAVGLQTLKEDLAKNKVLQNSTTVVSLAALLL